MTHPGLSAAAWRTSSYSNGDGGECVEVADGVPGLVPVRDTKDRGGPTLLVPVAAWRAFTSFCGSGASPRS
ncbi:DUF397 domain-containing protein [Streptomyces sp. SBT349]|uniref:DUF397 domain-containing protein n=1 Tax=Streptomyces sp. SBT349 TaxID=1580539 RepID=UPI00066B33E1|nr:DUF397 domain-containing protein [Streptomyces sp. SBT349]